MRKQERDKLKAEFLALTVSMIRVPGLREDLGPCWEWRGARAGKHRQVGVLNVAGKRWTARRWAWELWEMTKLEDDQTLESLCGNPICVNPIHLRIGTKNKGGRPKGTVRNKHAKNARGRQRNLFE